MQISLSNLTFDSSIYPRGVKNERTIEAYMEALSSGAEFPPIKIQRVINYPNGKEKTKATLILDGLHRFSAFKRCGFRDIPAREWNHEPLDYEKNHLNLLLESANSNITHGDRLSPNDKKRVAREIAGSDPECRLSETSLARKLGVVQQTVNTWISDIRARQKSSRNTIILRLHRLGWTQEQISDVAGIERSVISKIVQNTKIGNMHNLISQGRDMNYISSHYNMNLALAWTLRLDGKTDQEKFRELGWGLRTWDHWSFNECDERFGDDWPGRIPAQLVAHTLFFFTKRGDMVFDPMAGGGVVPDVCMLFERNCQAFDLAPANNRPEIRYHYWDLENMAWPVTKKPDLIFFDPPYFSKKAKEYERKAHEKTPPISSYKKENYEKFFQRFFLLAHEKSKKTTKIAFLNADWRDFESTPALNEETDKSITIFDYHRILSGTGWEITHRIECPLSSERLTGNEVQKMQDKRILGTVGRTLLIAKRS